MKLVFHSSTINNDAGPINIRFTVLYLASEEVRQNKLEQNNTEQRNRTRNNNDPQTAICETIMPTSRKPGSVLYTLYSRWDMIKCSYERCIPISQPESTTCIAH